MDMDATKKRYCLELKGWLPGRIDFESAWGAKAIFDVLQPGMMSNGQQLRVVVLYKYYTRQKKLLRCVIGYKNLDMENKNDNG